MNEPSRERSVDDSNSGGGGRWLRRWVKGSLVLGCALAVWLSAATCTNSPNLAPGVVKKTEQVRLGAELVKVDFYFQAQPEPRPLVVVAHGFTRSKRYMAGWGADLAARGMVAAVLTQPFLAKHERNAKVIAALVENGRAGEWPVAARGNGKVALVGYSMGGLTTLLAAAKVTEPADAWVGLDPVDFDGRGAKVADRVQAVGLALLAEPAPFNRKGNALEMLKPYGGDLQMVKVIGASHMDAEYPADWLGQLTCGWVNPERQAKFRRLTLDFLSAVLLGDGQVKAKLEPGEERVALVRGK